MLVNILLKKIKRENTYSLESTPKPKKKMNENVSKHALVK
jgi:hypothetical protein